VAVYQNALVLYLLHYPDAIRPLSEFALPERDFKNYKISNQELEISKKLILSMTKKWDPKKYKDEYKKAVHRWAEEVVKKRPHKIIQSKADIEISKTADFMSLLKKSLASSQSLKKKSGFAQVHKAMQHKALARHGARHVKH
jgi:non-homologous end joining protein Ku